MTELSNERLAEMLNAEVPFDMATDTMRSILSELLSLRLALKNQESDRG